MEPKITIRSLSISLKNIRDPEANATLYNISVETKAPSKAWTTIKRFSDFQLFDDNMFALTGDGTSFFEGVSILPPLPEKKFWGRFDPTFVEGRVEALQVYLNGILDVLHAVNTGSKFFIGSETHADNRIERENGDGENCINLQDAVSSLLHDFFEFSVNSENKGGSEGNNNNGSKHSLDRGVSAGSTNSNSSRMSSTDNAILDEERLNFEVERRKLEILDEAANEMILVDDRVYSKKKKKEEEVDPPPQNEIEESKHTINKISLRESSPPQKLPEAYIGHCSVFDVLQEDIFQLDVDNIGDMLVHELGVKTIIDRGMDNPVVSLELI